MLHIAKEEKLFSLVALNPNVRILITGRIIIMESLSLRLSGGIGLKDGLTLMLERKTHLRWKAKMKVNLQSIRRKARTGVAYQLITNQLLYR